MKINLNLAFIIILLTLLKVIFTIKDTSHTLIELNDNNYDEFIQNNDYVLIFLYPNPCLFCKQILPELEKTNKIISNFNVKLSKVDFSENPHIKTQLNIERMSIRFIYKSRPIDYTGGRTNTEIAKWVKTSIEKEQEEENKLIGEVTTVNEIEELKTIVRNLLVFFGENQNESNNKYYQNLEKIFYKVKSSKIIEDVFHIICKSEECLEFYNVIPGNVILFKKYDEASKNEFKFSDYHEEDLIEFIKESLKPSVMKFDFSTANFIFEQNNPGLFLYRHKLENEIDEYYPIISKIANNLKGKLHPVISDLVEIAEIKLGDLIGIKQSNLPLIMIHDSRDILKNYKMNSEITEENILQFVEDWENNLLERHIKSKPEPKLQKSNEAFVLVGNSLEKYILNEDKDVIVFFYAPWCKHSKEFMPIYEKVKRALNNSKKILMAKFDAHYNEASIIKLQYYPTIVIWKAGDKDKFIIFDSERNEENLMKFINLNVKYPIEINK